MRIQSLFSLTAVAATLGVGSSLHAAVVYSDSFVVDNTAADTSRDPGDPLAGTTTEVGGGVWATNITGPAFTFGQIGATTNGTVRMDGAPANSFAMLPLTLGATDIVTVEARLKPFHASNDNWIAIGFNTGATVFTEAAPGKLWLLVRQNTAASNGTGVFGANGGTGANNRLALTTTPGSPDADGYHTVSLTYDKGANTVAVAINGQAVTLNMANLGTPSFTHVGFQFLATDGDAAIDDFKVTVTPVPEPAAMAMLGLGGLLLVKRAHSR